MRYSSSVLAETRPSLRVQEIPSARYSARLGGRFGIGHGVGSTKLVQRGPVRRIRELHLLVSQPTCARTLTARFISGTSSQ